MSAQWPPPRWRAARPGPHKHVGLEEPLFARLPERRSTVRPSSLSSRRPHGPAPASRSPVRVDVCDVSGVSRLRLPLEAHALPQRCPGDPSELGGERDDHGVVVRPRQQTSQPLAGRVLSFSHRGQRRSRPVDEEPAQVGVPRLLMPSSFGLPPVVCWRGTRPSQAARSRARVKVLPSSTAARRAVAVIVPMPGIDTRRRAASSARACSTNSRSSAAMRRSRSVHCRGPLR